MRSPRAQISAATRFSSPGFVAQENTALQREVRNAESMDVEISFASSARCSTCTKDRQKCTRKDANQTKCDRCLEFNYVCTVDDSNTPANSKRRTLQKFKCELCRSAKVKCEPIDRTWPEKCNRCREKGFACSEPQKKKRSQADGRTVVTPKSLEDSDESLPDYPRIMDDMAMRGRPQAEPKTRLGSTPIQNSNRHKKQGRQSFSDVIDKVLNQFGDYAYSPLKDDQIRLLIVHPGMPDDDLQCSIVTESLQNSQPYQAVSYRWGSDAPSDLIRILSYKTTATAKTKSLRDIQYAKIYTRPNIFGALRQLRKSDEELVLYVNALCIDHRNRDEKYNQSAKTREIFQRASNVIVWLGKETATSKKAFQFISHVSNLTEFDSLLKDQSRLNDWIALADLMRDPLFGRRWLIQELAVAQHATLHCGEDSVEWSDFSDAVVLFETNLPKIQQQFKSFWMTSGGPMDDIHALGASKLVRVVSKIVSKTPDEKTLNYLETLESLVSMLPVFEASDPLDTIIAVIGLAKDRAQLEAIQKRIDKEQRVLEVYIAFVRYCVASGSIDIICRHWAPAMKESLPGAAPGKVNLPSWILSVNGSAFGAPGNIWRGRVNGDSFVGLPNRPIYRASYGFPPSKVTFGTSSTTHGYHLFDGIMQVSGQILDKIGELGARAAQGLIHRESLEMGGWTVGSKTVPLRLWRTLVADRGHDSDSPPSWYARACLDCLQKCDNNGDFNTTTLLNEPNFPETSVTFLKRVQNVTWNRKFLLSESDAHGGHLLGLAPANSKVGDLICILYGCSVPVILRECVTPDDHYFEFIGESFIYGMMDGEASAASANVPDKEVVFKLR